MICLLARVFAALCVLSNLQDQKQTSWAQSCNVYFLKIQSSVYSIPKQKFEYRASHTSVKGQWIRGYVLQHSREDELEQEIWGANGLERQCQSRELKCAAAALPALTKHLMWFEFLPQASPSLLPYFRCVHYYGGSVLLEPGGLPMLTTAPVNYGRSKRETAW